MENVNSLRIRWRLYERILRRNRAFPLTLLLGYRFAVLPLQYSNSYFALEFIVRSWAKIRLFSDLNTIIWILGCFLNLFIAFCNGFCASHWIVLSKFSLGITLKFGTIFAKKAFQFFLIKVIFKRVLRLPVKKDFIGLQNILLSATSVVLI